MITNNYCTIDNFNQDLMARGCIFSCVRPFYEQAVSNLDP